MMAGFCKPVPRWQNQLKQVTGNNAEPLSINLLIGNKQLRRVIGALDEPTACETEHLANQAFEAFMKPVERR